MARRRNRSVWAVLVELDRAAGHPAGRPGDPRDGRPTLVADLQAYSERRARAAGRRVALPIPARERDAGPTRRRRTPWPPRKALGNIARFFEIVRAQSAILADDRAVFVARHLETLIEAGDDPATAELDPDPDAVAVLTVHKAKGLEFPVRLPARDGRRPLPVDAVAARRCRCRPVWVAARRPTPESALAEERRLCYVAMTRARDELILSHAADYGGARARRVSPFVLEALDLPAAAGVPGAGAAPSPARSSAWPRSRRSARQRRAMRSPRRRRPDRRAAVAELLPDRRLPDLPAQVQVRPRAAGPARAAPRDHLRRGPAQGGPAVPPAARQGSRHVRGRAGGSRSPLAWSNEGFVSREHEEARLEAGRAALRRFRAAQLESDAVIPTYVEREFSFQLGGDRVRGRWDRVDVVPLGEGECQGCHPTSARTADASADVVSPTLDMLGPERVTITDYKSSDVRDPVKARQRARDSLQLQIYAMGYEAMTGRLPDAVALHFLESGLVGEVAVDPKRLAKARGKIEQAAAGMRARDYTATAGLPRLHVLRVPRHLPVERRPAIGHSPESTVPRRAAILRAPRRSARRRRTGGCIDHGG